VNRKPAVVAAMNGVCTPRAPSLNSRRASGRGEIPQRGCLLILGQDIAPDVRSNGLRQGTPPRLRTWV